MNRMARSDATRELLRRPNGKNSTHLDVFVPSSVLESSVSMNETNVTGGKISGAAGAGGCTAALQKTAKEMKKQFAKFIPMVKLGVATANEPDDLQWIPPGSFRTIIPQDRRPSLPGIQEMFEEHAYPDISLEPSSVTSARDDNIKQTGGRCCFQKCLMQMVGRHDFTFITAELKEEIWNSIRMDFNEILLQQHALGSQNTNNAIHMAAAHVIQEFLAARPIFQATNMPSTNQDAVYEVVEDFVYPQIVCTYSAIENVTPADAAQAITWIDTFLETMTLAYYGPTNDDDDDDDCCNTMIRQSWIRDRDDLFVHYIVKGVQREMDECLHRATALQSEDDIRQDAHHGYLVTGFPGQIAFLYHQQLCVAQTALPVLYHEIVLAVCNQEMGRIVADLQHKITSEWKDMSSSYFCALINDASILSEQCEERNHLFLQLDEYKKAGNALVRDLVELSLHATRFLCEHIMLDRQTSEPILKSVGSAAWESDIGTSRCRVAVTERMIDTFQEYFEDVQTWIMSPDYYFPKLLKTCLDSTLEKYLEFFFSNTMANGVQDAAVVADELRDDYVRLAGFFNGPRCDAYHGSGGFYTQHAINERLRLLQSLATLVDPSTRPANEMGDIKAVLSEFQACGQASAVVLHLVGLHKGRRSREESTEWVKAIAVAKKELDESKNDNNNKDEIDHDRIGILPSLTPPLPVRTYHVPDLSQSRYVYNIRPTRLEKKVSVGTLPYAASTLELVKSPGLTNRVRFGMQSVSPQLVDKVRLGMQSVSPSAMDRIQLGIQKVGLK